MIFEIFCLALRDHFKYYFEKEKKTKSDWSILKLSESDNQSDLLRRFRTVRGSHENQNFHYQKQKSSKVRFMEMQLTSEKNDSLLAPASSGFFQFQNNFVGEELYW